MKNSLLFLFSAVLFALTGCANLAHVNSFSTTAVKTIKSYDDIGYNFTNSYYNYTLGQNAYEMSGDINANSLKLPLLQTSASEPKTASEADKAINFYIISIASYFEALAKLSDKDLVNYNFDEVSKNLKADQTLKTKLGISNDDQIDAGAKIATVFTKELAGAYRESKIRHVMIEHDGDVSKSIQALVDILTNAILPALNNDNGLIDVKYQVLMRNPKVDLSKKADLLKNYNDEKIKVDKYKTQINQLIEALGVIKDEHNKTATLLKDQKLTAQNVIEIINQHAAKVYQIYSNIKSLSSKSN